MKPKASRTLAIGLSVFVGGAALAEDMATGAINPLPTVKFSQDNDVACLVSALETGDPANGRSTFILKASPGCVVPWHFHTAEEQLIVTGGAVLAEMTGHQPARLGRAGLP